MFETDSKFSANEIEKIDHLRSLLELKGDLNIGTEDIFLAKFLNFTNWHVERAYTAIFRYYDFKMRQPEWHFKTPLDQYRHLFFQTKSRYVLPNTDKNGRMVTVMKAVDAFDQFPNFFHYNIQMDDMLSEALLMLPKVQKQSAVVIQDVTGTTKNWIRAMTPTNMRLLVEKYETIPLKDRIIHIVQKGVVLNALTNTMLAFMSKDFREKVFTHEVSDLNNLRDAIGYDSLPAEFGGPEKNVADFQFTWSLVEPHLEYLLQLSNYNLSNRQK